MNYERFKSNKFINEMKRMANVKYAYYVEWAVVLQTWRSYGKNATLISLSVLIFFATVDLHKSLNNSSGQTNAFLADCFRILRFVNWIEFGSSGSSKYKQHTRASNENEKQIWKSHVKQSKQFRVIFVDLI